MTTENVELNLKLEVHKRYNPLSGEHVLVSPHRNLRPWQGTHEKQTLPTLKHDPKCYLCPRNTRVNGKVNEDYWQTWVFDNDFPAILEDEDDYQNTKYSDGLLQAESVKGIARVIIFDKDHSVTLPLLSCGQLVNVIDLWVDQYKDIKKKEYIKYIQIFENKGAMVGCSNPHPHGQIWATDMIPDLVGKKINSFNEYFKKHNKSLLSAYLDQELADKDKRVVIETDKFVALVPFWAYWPFETYIIPKRHIPSVDKLSIDEKSDFAKILSALTIKYDNLFKCSFPYCSGLFNAPVNCNQEEINACHFHVMFYPPLLRNASVKKHMAGYEFFANCQRDITPEQAAEMLRNVSGDVHYTMEIEKE